MVSGAPGAGHRRAKPFVLWVSTPPRVPGADSVVARLVRHLWGDWPRSQDPVRQESAMRKPAIPSRGAAAASEPDSSVPMGSSRRDFLKASGGLAAAAAVPATLSGAATATAGAADHAKPRVTFRDPKRKVLKGGIVLTLDGTDYEKADVVVE